MKHRSWKAQTLRPVIGAGVFAGVAAIAALTWYGLGGSSAARQINLLFWVMTVLLAAAAATLAVSWLKYWGDELSRKQTSISLEVYESLQHRLEGMVRLNRLILDTLDEKELVEQALKIIADVIEAQGASFVPYDEWGQPVHSYVVGSYPARLLAAWSEHISLPEIRQRCQVCRQHFADASSACPLLDAPFTDVIKVYCLPLSRNAHPVGMVNLYLKAKDEISPELHDYLVLLLNEMSLAIEMNRLRNQEMITLEQLQLANSQQEDLTTIVGKLIDGLRDVLDFKSSRVVFRAAELHFPGLELISGDDPWLSSEEADSLIRQMIESTRSHGVPFQVHARTDGQNLLLMPFRLPEGTVIGAALMCGSHQSKIQPRQAALIETVATQTALLVENERRQREMEYRTIVQERTRLAREIHDSLAQTLAYLKLTAAQMQSQLSQGDLTRLSKNLAQSHQALSEAYLEVRQVIDNLRFAPQQDMISWLNQIFTNFEQNSGLKVIQNYPGRLPQISPEVQAQLVRIIQEGLSNVRKHANASTVWINIQEWQDELIFDLCDDGKGFSPEDVPDLSRYGLRGMRERAELIGAEFQITSKPGQGTTIHVEVPVRMQETSV